MMINRYTLILFSLSHRYINLCDGAADEDRAGIEVIAALERLKLPYTGADVGFYEPSREEMKLVATANDVLTPAWHFVFDMERDFPNLMQAIQDGTLSFPLIAKHYNSYGSIAMTKDCKVKNEQELRDKVQGFINEYGGCLVEQFIVGREFTVLVSQLSDASYSYDPDALVVYPPVECLFSKGEDFKHFDLKFADAIVSEEDQPKKTEGTIEWTKCEDQAINEALAEASKRIFIGLSGRGYARLDFRSDEAGNVYFLEINPNCGIFYPPDNPDQGSADYILNLSGPNGHEVFLQCIMDSAIAEHKHKMAHKRMFKPLALMNEVPPEMPTLVANDEEENDKAEANAVAMTVITNPAETVQVTGVVEAVRGTDMVDDEEVSQRLLKWNIIVWTVVPNNLQLGAWRDLAKLTSQYSSSDIAVHMLMETEDTGTWRIRLHGDPQDKNSLMIFRHDPIDHQDATILSDFISNASRVDPAERYMVVLQGHGFGWYLKVDSSGTVIPLDSLRDALMASQVPISILGLDACCLGTLEMVECLHEVAETIIACQGYCPWDGIVSDRILHRLDDMSQKDNVDVAKGLIDDFIAQQPDPPTDLSSFSWSDEVGDAAPADMAVYKTSALKPLLEFLNGVKFNEEHFVVDAAVDEIDANTTFLEKQPIRLVVHNETSRAIQTAARSEFQRLRDPEQIALQKKFSMLYDLHTVASAAITDEMERKQFEALFRDLVPYHGTNKLFRKYYPKLRGMAFVRGYNASLPMSLGVDVDMLAAWSSRPDRTLDVMDDSHVKVDNKVVSAIRQVVNENEDLHEEVVSDILNLVTQAVEGNTDSKNE